MVEEEISPYYRGEMSVSVLQKDNIAPVNRRNDMRWFSLFVFLRRGGFTLHPSPLNLNILTFGLCCDGKK